LGRLIPLGVGKSEKEGEKKKRGNESDARGTRFFQAGRGGKKSSYKGKKGLVQKHLFTIRRGKRETPTSKEKEKDAAITCHGRDLTEGKWRSITEGGRRSVISFLRKKRAYAADWESVPGTFRISLMTKGREAF